MKSRVTELLMLSSFCLLLCVLAGYSDPYVISFSDRAIDVFDSSTAEWLQTIPLKKVKFEYRIVGFDSCFYTF